MPVGTSEQSFLEFQFGLQYASSTILSDFGTMDMRIGEMYVSKDRNQLLSFACLDEHQITPEFVQTLTSLDRLAIQLHR